MVIDERYAPIAVEILVAELDDDLFVDLAAIADGAPAELALSAPRDVTVAADLYFDVDAVLHTVRSVTAVVSGVGGAAKVVDWVLGKLRERRGKSIILKSGSTSVTVKTGDDPEQARRLLEAALKAL
jgi:hypothetical protein